MMTKSNLLAVLNEGLSSNHITSDDLNLAIQLYHSIYETRELSEFSPEHATLASLINKASGLTTNDLKKILTSDKEYSETEPGLLSMKEISLLEWEELRDFYDRCINAIKQVDDLKKELENTERRRKQSAPYASLYTSIPLILRHLKTNFQENIHF